MLSIVLVFLHFLWLPWIVIHAPIDAQCTFNVIIIKNRKISLSWPISPPSSSSFSSSSSPHSFSSHRSDLYCMQFMCALLYLAIIPLEPTFRTMHTNFSCALCTHFGLSVTESAFIRISFKFHLLCKSSKSHFIVS